MTERRPLQVAESLEAPFRTHVRPHNDREPP